MIKSAVNQRQHMSDALHELHIDHADLSPMQWDCLADAADLLEIFDQVTKTLSSESSVCF